MRAPAFLALLAALCLWTPAAVAAQDGPSETAFRELLARIRQDAAGGDLPSTAVERADAVAFDLHTRLIRADADIEILKLEVKRFTGAEQDAALDALVAAVAARERQVLQHLRELEEVSGRSGQEPTARREKPNEEVEESREGQAGIVFEPEDPTTGDQP